MRVRPALEGEEEIEGLFLEDDQVGNNHFISVALRVNVNFLSRSLPEVV